MGEEGREEGMRRAEGEEWRRERDVEDGGRGGERHVEGGEGCGGCGKWGGGRREVEGGEGRGEEMRGMRRAKGEVGRGGKGM